jgi:hypothetical protein
MERQVKGMPDTRVFASGRIFLSTLGCLAVSFATGPARAQEYSGAAAVALGEVLGAEAFCGLSYDQSAIRDSLDKNGRKDDMGFASTLRMVTGWTRYQGLTMSASAKADRCNEIEQVARPYGFIR